MLQVHENVLLHGTKMSGISRGTILLSCFETKEEEEQHHLLPMKLMFCSFFDDVTGKPP